MVEPVDDPNPEHGKVDRPSHPVIKNNAWAVDDFLRDFSREVRANPITEMKAVLSALPGDRVEPAKAQEIFAKSRVDRLIEDQIAAIIPKPATAIFGLTPVGQVIASSTSDQIACRMVFALKHQPEGLYYVLPVRDMAGELNFEDFLNPAFLVADFTIFQGAKSDTVGQVRSILSEPALRESNERLRGFLSYRGFTYNAVMAAFVTESARHYQASEKDIKALISERHSVVTPLQTEPTELTDPPTRQWKYFAAVEHVGQATVKISHDVRSRFQRAEIDDFSPEAPWDLSS